MQQGWLLSGWIIFSCAIFFSVVLSSFSDAGLIDGSVDQEDIHDDDDSSSKNYNWWTSMFEGLPGETNIAQPANRRGHSATYFIDDQSTEWMIVSGGFTDEDWHSMPVWAYDLTTGKEMENYNNDLSEMLGKWDVADDWHPWVSMVFQGEQQPPGRVGHLSSTYKDCLYIFGGLTYNFGFSVEFADNGYNSLVVCLVLGGYS